MNTTFSHVPPGFRFHPTDEELVDYYLRKKINGTRIDLDVIRDVDLYKIEPWDLQELCSLGTDDQNEWYFFSHKDKKYPTGTRTNRATTAGFWKATGRDKAIYSKHDLIGMRKTLVFYKGRAPNGQKSDWIMHEYRLETDENAATQEEGWVVCRVFKKRIATINRRMSEHESPLWYDDGVSFMTDMDSPKQNPNPNMTYHYSNYSCKKELDLQYQIPQEHFHQLPLLESPKILQQTNSMPLYGFDINHVTSLQEHVIHENRGQNLEPIYVPNNTNEQEPDQVTDWRVLHKFVASQLSHEDLSKENDYSTSAGRHSNIVDTHLNKQESMIENASTSTSSCQIDLWK